MSKFGVWLVAFVVAVGAALLSVPLILNRFGSSPDVANYLGVANAFAHGAGFVEPIQWHYYLPGTPPQPAFAFLSPVISLVLAVPIALGSSVTGAVVVHALVASAVGGMIVIVARRFMSLPAAAAAAIAVSWSPMFTYVSHYALTEPYGILGVLLIVGSAPGVLRSHRGALLCASCTLFGWLCRANVPALALAVFVAVLCAKGIRHRPLWTYVAATLLSIVVVSELYALVTGVKPYANYDAFFEMFYSTDLTKVRKQYVGALAFIERNHVTVIARIGAIAKKSFTLMFTNDVTLFAGFVFPLVMTWGIFGRSENAATDLARRVAAFGALGFWAQTILTYGGYESRYLLLALSCAWLAAMASLDQLVPRQVRLLPLAVVLVVVALAVSGNTAPKSANAWRAYRERGRSMPAFKDGAGIPTFCRLMDRRYVAIGTEAEALHFYCGNPTMRLPIDLDKQALQRFLRERNPRYFLVESKRAENFRKLGSFKQLGKNSRYVLFEASAFRGAPNWRRAPPPLACIGAEAPACPRRQR